MRYDRKDAHFCAFLTLAAALTGYKNLAQARATRRGTILERGATAGMATDSNL